MDGDRRPLARDIDPTASQPGDPAAADAASVVRSGDWQSSHPVNLRISVPTPVGSYYVTLVAGKERRSPERRAAERRKHRFVTLGNLTVLFAVGCCLGFAGLYVTQLVSIFILTQTGIVVTLP